MSILSSVMRILEPTGISVPREDRKPADDCGDDKQSKSNDDHKGRDDHLKDAKNDDCQPHKDYCQPQNDYCDPKPSDDCGKGDTSHNPGEVLARFDFSHGDLGSHGPDHSGDMQGALASMSSDQALEYAIGQMGPADHFDVGHFDVAAETSNDTDG